jgi:hypothetical protein
MTAPKKMSTMILYGGIASLAMILFTVGTWFGGPRVFMSVGFFRYLIPVIFAVVAALVERNRLGYLDFRAALRICFGIIVVAFAVEGIFTWILFHVIDPAFDQTLRPLALANAEWWYRHFGMPEDQIRANIDAAKEIDPFGPGAIAFGLAKTYVFFFLVAVLLAAVLKRKKTVVEKA